MKKSKLPSFTTLAQLRYTEVSKSLGKKTKELFNQEIIKEFGNRNDNFLMSIPELETVINKLKL